MQPFKIAGEGQSLVLASAEGSVLAVRANRPGLLQTIGNIIRLEGARYVDYDSNLRNIEQVKELYIIRNISVRYFHTDLRFLFHFIRTIIIK